MIYYSIYAHVTSARATCFVSVDIIIHDGFTRRQLRASREKTGDAINYAAEAPGVGRVLLVSIAPKMCRIIHLNTGSD